MKILIDIIWLFLFRSLISPLPPPARAWQRPRPHWPPQTLPHSPSHPCVTRGTPYSLQNHKMSLNITQYNHIQDYNNLLAIQRFLYICIHIFTIYIKMTEIASLYYQDDELIDNYFLSIWHKLSTFRTRIISWLYRSSYISLYSYIYYYVFTSTWMKLHHCIIKMINWQRW